MGRCEALLPEQHSRIGTFFIWYHAALSEAIYS